MDKTYFIQGADGGPIKIGRARDPELRLQRLQCGSPIVLRLLASTSTITERGAHVRFADARLHGEWFEPTARLMAFITKLQSEEAMEHDAIVARVSARAAAERRKAEREVLLLAKIQPSAYWPRPVSDLEKSMPEGSLAARLLAKIRGKC